MYVFGIVLIVLVALASGDSQEWTRGDTVPHAEIWFHNRTNVVTGITSADAWFKIHGFEEDEAGELLVGFTHDGNGTLTVTTPGLYEATFTSSFSSAGVNDDYEISVFIGEVSQNKTNIHRTIGSSGQIGAVAGEGMLDLFAGDEITVRISNFDAARDALFRTFNLNIVRIAGNI